MTRIADVVEQWKNPVHDWIQGSAWHLFNAFTYTMAGRVAANPAATRTLHEVIDVACTVH